MVSLSNHAGFAGFAFNVRPAMFYQPNLPGKTRARLPTIVKRDQASFRDSQDVRTSFQMRGTLAIS